MHVLDVHRRRLEAPMVEAGRLLDQLGSRHDLLWPGDAWPPMRLDGILKPGTRGGHGPIRYEVTDYAPGRRVAFRFTRPAGFDGTHAFDLVPMTQGGCELVHTLAMDAHGAARWTWPLLWRPLHAALLEDALDRACALTGTPFRPAAWSPWVMLLRSTMRGRT